VRELERAIEHAIAQLPPRTREAFVLCRLNGLPQHDAAQVMGVSPRTVETQVGLALKALRRQLAEWLG
jgi:RNA polymerase sigma-70 factor (ECF subfamily)